VIRVDDDVCVLCGLCTGVCPPNALELGPSKLTVLSHCSDCGYCVPYCPVGALSGGRASRRSGAGGRVGSAD
jgi:ferredoxin